MTTALREPDLSRPIIRLLLNPFDQPADYPQVTILTDPDADKYDTAASATSSTPTKRSKSSASFAPVEALLRLVWAQSVRTLDWSCLGTECPIVAVVTSTDTWTDLVARLLGRWNASCSIARLEKPKDVEKLRTEHLPVMRPLIIVTHDRAMLSRTVTAGLDATIVVDPPTVDMIADLIQQASGRAVIRKQRDRLSALVHLDPYDLSALIRRGRSRDAIFATIERLSSRKNRGQLPDLATSSAFGNAGTWGRQLATDLDAWRRGDISWSEVDRGCLLWGPPGVGKTLFAQALAEHCGIPLITASIGQLFMTGDSHLGSVVRALRKTFTDAAANTPSILFFDEIDSLPSRETMDQRALEWWGTVVTDFLTLLDGAVNDRVGVIVIAATNRPTKVDTALLRPGRLERRVHIGAPDATGLMEVIRHHLKADLAGADLADICDQAVGATPADAMLAVREARRTARNGNRPLALEDLRSAFHLVELPPPEMRWRASVHESGHAFIAHKVGRRVETIVVKTEGKTHGHMVSTQVGTFEGTREQFLDGLRVLLGGRAAEELLLCAPSAGAGFAEDSDLARASELALHLELSSGLGSLAIVPIDQLPKLAQCTEEVRTRIETLLAHLYGEVLAILDEENQILRRLAEAVYGSGEIGSSEIKAIIDGDGVI